MPKYYIIRPLDQYNTPKVRVWLVNGFAVRNRFTLDFIQGGHNLRYRFIPFDEIWIDNAVLPHERRFVVVHELVERELMLQGMTYNKAHEWANRIELQARSR